MIKTEKIIEIFSPLLGIFVVISFNYFFPDVSKNILFLIGISLTIYGILLSFLSLVYYKNLSKVPESLAAIEKIISDLLSIKESYYMLPLEYTLNWEKIVTKNVSVVTFDFTWNINEVGVPQNMFDTIVHNIKRGINYDYYVIDSSPSTKQNLELLTEQINNNLKDKPKLSKNFNVHFINEFPLLFSFAIFDIDVPKKDFYGFIFVHTLEKPMAIPMNLETYKHARKILFSIK